MAVLASQQFQAAVKQSHNAIVTVTAQRGPTSFALDFTDGKITQSYDDASRWMMDLTFPVPSGYTPDSLKNLLNQRATTLRPARGIQFADGTSEVMNFAKFYVTDVDLDEQAGGAPVIKVLAYDRSVRCQGDMSKSFYIPANSSPTLMTAQLLNSKVPGITFALASSLWLTPPLLVTQDMDAWDEARRMMSASGQDLYFDREDRCVSSVRSLTPNATGVWHFDENNNPDFWDVKRHGSNDIFPNIVNVVGTNPAAPGIAGQAADMDPSSPTYRFGDYGEIVRTFRSEHITTTLQANSMAAYLLAKLLGPQDEVTLSAIPNPMLDVGDTVLLTRVSMGFSATPLLVVKIEMPLTIGGSMTVTLRRSILTDIYGSVTRP